jgi:hypothetical protein
MTFPKPEPGVQMKGKVDGQLLSAGSAEHYSTTPRKYFGVLRHQGSPRWTCIHQHTTSRDARLCAAAELGRRLAAEV